MWTGRRCIFSVFIPVKPVKGQGRRGLKAGLPGKKRILKPAQVAFFQGTLYLFA
jgi:hypothetical protein